MNVIEIIIGLTEKVGSNDPNDIESIIADLSTIREWADGVEMERNNLQDDLTNANERIRALQKANNALMRDLAVNVEKEEKEEESLSDQLASMF